MVDMLYTPNNGPNHLTNSAAQLERTVEYADFISAEG